MIHRKSLFPRPISFALVSIFLAALPLACARGPAATPQAAAVQRTPATQPMDPTVARIRDEGLNRSQVMDTLDSLTNVIGPRLTGSPGGHRGSEWSRQRLEQWGLVNAHLEEWGPLGRGWEVRRFSMQLTQPYATAVVGYPKAWSPGFDQPIEAEVVHLDAKNEGDLAKFKGKLKGKIVLIGAPREVQARFEPLANRLSDDDLEKLASQQIGSSALLAQPQTITPPERRAQFAAAGAAAERLMNRGGGDNRDTAAATPADRPPTTAPTTRPSRGGRGFDRFSSRALQFATEEGAAVVCTASTKGDGGTFFVTSASIPGENPLGGSTTRPTTRPSTQPAAAAPATSPANRPRVWSVDAPKMPAQILLAIEDFNRIARLLAKGESVRVYLDLNVKFYAPEESTPYNTVAEIPGTDLAHEIVMVGGHIDSWHAGSGATDNAAGAACSMEAGRIIKALGLKPRRTIRVALWTGEEQGLYGSAAYVKKHFGHDPDAETRRASERARRMAALESGEELAPASQPAARKLTKQKDYENLSVYFNLDNGTGKIRGIYAQSNAAAVPIFKRWLEPFHDLGARTVTISNTGSTDHASFDSIGLPGFQFIQDPMEYSSRTHHSNQDNFDRLQPDDMKQASTIMAAFVWQAANMDERFPRKQP